VTASATAPDTGLDALVATVRELQLLEPPQLREATGSIREGCADAAAWLKELGRRGWLTPLQRQRLQEGRAGELRLGPYVLLDRLGQGGMGEVFKARHLLLGRLVALKLLNKSYADVDDKQRFLREIQTTARLSHPNIVHALDAAQVGEQRFLALEFIDGTDLGHFVKARGPLPVAVACEYIRQAALGLQHAFENGLVHRDIKPSNLLVSADGKQVKISDLGLVVSSAERGGTPLTRTGVVLGTPDYLAPEQATDARLADIRSDLYSLGCTFYFLLTGQPPFPDGTAIEKIFKHIQQAPPPIQTLRPEIPAGVAAVVHKLLAKLQDDRYPRPLDLIADLDTEQQATVATPRQLLSPEPAPAPVPAAPNPTAAPAPAAPKPAAAEAPQRSRAVLVGYGIAALLLVGAIAFWYGKLPGQRQAKPQEITNSLGMHLVSIPAGELKLDAPGGGPSRKVVLRRPYFLAVSPTTVAQFRAFTQATHFQTDAEKKDATESHRGAERWDSAKQSWIHDPECNWRNPGWPLADDQPVVCVSRLDALAFCLWLARNEGKAYRLPSEVELEYAWRAGTGDGERPAPTLGNRPDSVAALPANAWGLSGLTGAVWQWCVAYTSPEGAGANRAGSGSDLRNEGLGLIWGGSWTVPPGSGPDARRLEIPTGGRRSDVGFRLVMEAESR
jgi:serine/threonine-protein kinase